MPESAGLYQRLSVNENLAYFAWAFCFGLAASDLTARSGTLAPALALHLVNNARVFLFFGTEDGPDSGLALILLPAEPDLPLLPFDTLDPLIALPPQLLLLALLWGAARVAGDGTEQSQSHRVGQGLQLLRHFGGRVLAQGLVQ